jgi:DNA-binding IscR family transcriptional regulator
MRVSAKVDYAVRAMCELAAHDAATPVKAETIAEAQASHARSSRTSWST